MQDGISIQEDIRFINATACRGSESTVSHEGRIDFHADL